MSENFELLKHPLHHRLNPLNSSQQSHVAQQIRRDKLRIAQHVSGYIPSTSSSPAINPNFLQSRELEESRNGGIISSDVFSGLSGTSGLIPLQDPNSMSSSEMMVNFIASTEFPLVKENNIVNDVGGWKGINSLSNSEYLINYTQQSTHNPVSSSILLGPVAGGEFPFLNSDARSSLTSGNPAGNGGIYRFSGIVQQNPVHQSQILTQFPQEIPVDEEVQRLLVPNLPSFGNLQTGQLGFCGYKKDSEQNCPEASAERGFKMDSTGQGLSLSLSSHDPHDMQLQKPYEQRFGNQSVSHAMLSSYGIGRLDDKQKEECLRDSSDYASLQKAGASTLNSGQFAGSSGFQTIPAPLGPFSGYASVLKSSKFLNPAQQLLEEVCDLGKINLESSEGNYGRKFHDLERPIGMDLSCGVSGVSCNSPRASLVNLPRVSSTSSPSFLSADVHADPGVNSRISSPADRNEHRRKKTKLVSMLDEVYRLYRHHYRQFQMAVTSFESVSGLSNAAPYTSMALKAMSRHFRCLKTAINEQLKLTCMLLGEECLPPSGAARDKNLGSVGEGCSSVIEPAQQQHIWRPQRGLPERAVAVLRAWLFEHFLHPYPTDADKQILAKQTGLTRNQVSNWFINARVRLWKPLVEEIHSLESRDSSSSMDLNTARKPADSAMAAHGSDSRNHQSQLTQTPKRSRADHRLPVAAKPDICGGGSTHLATGASLGSCQPKEVGVNGGAVSLALGLRHNGLRLPASHSSSEPIQHLVSNDHYHYVNVGEGGGGKISGRANGRGSHFPAEANGDQRFLHMGKQIGGELLHDFVG